MESMNLKNEPQKHFEKVQECTVERYSDARTLRWQGMSGYALAVVSCFSVYSEFKFPCLAIEVRWQIFPAFGRRIVLQAARRRAIAGAVSSCRFTELHRDFCAFELHIVDAQSGERKGRPRLPIPVQTTLYP